MSRIDIHLPELGETIRQALISRWTRRVGERIARDELIAEYETDKANGEIAAPADGVLVDIVVGAGETAVPGEVVAVIDTAGVSWTEAARESEANWPEPAAEETREPGRACLRCGSVMEPANASGGISFGMKRVRLLVCRSCGHVEMVAEDPRTF